jgi:hypothetical protein
MAWELLPVDYTNAVWSGLKRYNEISNEDGTVSFQDVTAYTGKEKSFFGAKDANRMNEALNTIMSMVESGTDLYTAFQNYFAEQKTLFEAEADKTEAGFVEYTDGIKADYKTDIQEFENTQKQIFEMWFQLMKDQLSKDAAGNLQNEIDTLDIKTDGFESRNTAFATDGSITEIYGDKKIVTDFVSDTQIVQKLYVNGVLTKTKTINFSADGTTITEEVA